MAILYRGKMNIVESIICENTNTTIYEEDSQSFKKVWDYAENLHQPM